MKEIVQIAHVTLSSVTLISLLLLIILIIIFIPMAVDETMRFKRRKEVGVIITSKYSIEPLKKKEIEIFAAFHQLNHRDIYLIARRQFAEAIKATDDKRSGRMQYFRELYKDIEKNESFEGLPADLRLHLERIKLSLGERNYFLMPPLASYLKEFNAKNIRRQNILRAISIASLIFGAIRTFFPSFNFN